MSAHIPVWQPPAPHAHIDMLNAVASIFVFPDGPAWSLRAIPQRFRLSIFLIADDLGVELYPCLANVLDRAGIVFLVTEATISAYAEHVARLMNEEVAAHNSILLIRATPRTFYAWLAAIKKAPSVKSLRTWPPELLTIWGSAEGVA